MDRNELAAGLLEWAKTEGLELDGDLERSERGLRGLAHQVAGEALERQVNERRPGYEGASRRCPACGGWQRFVQMRAKKIATLLGRIEVRRAYYRCGCGCSALPYDQREGLGGRACSVAVAKAAVWCAADEPFERATGKLRELAGLELSPSTVYRITRQVGRAAAQREQREASGVAEPEVEAEPARLHTAVDGAFVRIDGRWQEVKAVACYWDDPGAGDGDPRRDRQTRYRVPRAPVEDFAPHAEALARRCGHERAGQSVLLGDGARWIWKRIGEALGPRTVHITDWYHVMEHVWQCGQALHGEGSPEAAAWVEPIEEMLWHGELRRLREHLDHQRQTAVSDAHRRAVEALSTYLRNQGDRLVYDDFRAAGYDIGSGRVEAACNHLIAHRTKGSGMQWSHPGFTAIASLRCTYLNRDEHPLWQKKPLAA